jgi:N-acetylglucosaminyldiphosphoundecaprenol N-acetyl-beta-D-mannosaminyltransferase
MDTNRYKIGNTCISITNPYDLKQHIDWAIGANRKGYICVTNTRTVYHSNHDTEYCKIQNNSFMTIPDGTPLVWMAHLEGFKKVQRISGPSLMVDLIQLSEEKNYSHYFYGSTENVIKKIENKFQKEYPRVVVKRLLAPPFQPIEKFDIETLAAELNELKPTFFWCGLGAPKQERLIALLQPHLQSTICIGVGLAFEYFAGTVYEPPFFFKKLKLEWFFRCLQQPIKARRFILPFFYMIGLLLQCFMKEKIFKK